MLKQQPLIIAKAEPRKAPAIILPAGADVSGLARAPRAPDMFDHSPARNRGMQGIDNDCSTEEWDNRLIATAEALGCPRVIAEQARTHPPARHSLLTVYCCVQLAAQGDGDAKEKVDYFRWCFEEARRQESIADTLDAPGNPLAASAETRDPAGLTLVERG